MSPVGEAIRAINANVLINREEKRRFTGIHVSGPAVIARINLNYYCHKEDR
jgi:hypothetical protein